MKRELLSAMIVVALLLMGAACASESSGAAEVVDEVVDETNPDESDGPPESPADEPADDGVAAPEVQPGGVLEGAPVPRDAAGGQVDTAYTDTVRGSESNYYRFDIAPGSEVRGELTISPNPDASPSSCSYLTLTDEGSEEYGYESGSGDPSREAVVIHTDPVVVDASEVWLKVETDTCQDEQVQHEVEFQLTVVTPA